LNFTATEAHMGEGNHDDRQRARRSAVEQAERFRDALSEAAAAEAAPVWECGRGHAWDDSRSTQHNVRCMNCATERREMETRRLRALAHERGGALLSPSYVDAATSLRWQCAFGHEWEAKAVSVGRRWCPRCARELYGVT
jgi:hypothetical protein